MIRRRQSDNCIQACLWGLRLLLMLVVLRKTPSPNKSVCSLRYTTTQNFRILYYKVVPIPMAALSKACVCGHSLARIAGSNPAGNMGVSLL
jgi:hypothetical protein